LKIGCSKSKDQLRFAETIQKKAVILTKFLVRVCQEGKEGNFKPCLIEDEGGPLEAAMQVEASNHRKLLRESQR